MTPFGFQVMVGPLPLGLSGGPLVPSWGFCFMRRFRKPL